MFSRGFLSCVASILIFLTAFTQVSAQTVNIQPKVGPLKCDANADDTAIWIHPTDKSKSLVFGTDKDNGFCAWTLQGQLVQKFPLATRFNNANVVYNFNFGGQNSDIFIGNLRALGKVGVWKINQNWTTGNAVTQLAGPNSTGTNISPDSYGWACWRNPTTSDVECFDKSASSAPIKHWKISGAGGVVSSTLIRTVNTDVSMAQSEGFAVNTPSKKVYFNEESPAQTHIYYADATLNPKTRLAVIQGNGLTPDLEGAAIYQCGNGNGYLVSSNQGSSNFKIFDLQNNQLVKTFTAQGSSGTDSLDVTSASVPGFPNGFLAIHNDPGADYRLYDWTDLGVQNCPNGYLADISGGETPQPTTPPSPTTVGPTSTTLACDLASDSDVCCGLREYNAVIANFNQNTAVGDFNADGRVTLVDYNIVIGQFNQCRN